MLVRSDRVEEEKKRDSEPESEKRREKGELSERGRLVDRGNEEAPDRRGDHHAGGEPGQAAPYALPEIAAHQKDACRAERGSDKRNREPQD